jgi:uncharacterized protein YpuA (DUF1002 family)
MANKLLEEILERVATWPEDRQEDVARVLIEMEEQASIGYGLTDEQVAEVERRRANPNRTFLTIEEVRERFAFRRP